MRQLTNLEKDVFRALHANRHLLSEFSDFKNTKEFIDRIDNGYWQPFFKKWKKLQDA